MSRHNVIYIFFLVVLMVGCGRRIHVSSDYDRDVDFHEYSTFTIEVQSSDSDDPRDVKKRPSLLDKRISGYIEDEMEMRGYSYVPRDENPDLIVVFHRDYDQRKEYYRDYFYGPPMGYWGGYGPYWGGAWSYGGAWGWGGMPYTDVVITVESIMVINVIDAETNELVWQGWASSDARSERKYEDKVQRAEEKVRGIMDEYQFRASQRGIPEEGSEEVRLTP